MAELVPTTFFVSALTRAQIAAITFTFEMITPEMALAYLEKNINNRPRIYAHIKKMARDMKNGVYKITHEAIAFDILGVLADGQNRLEAIVEAGVAVLMPVVRGLPQDAKLSMGTGKTRQPGHSISILRGDHVTNKEISIVKAAVAYTSSASYDRDRTTEELNSYYEMMLPAINWTQSVFPTRVPGITPATVQAAVTLAWFYVDDLARLQKFVEIFANGQFPDGPADSAAHVLRMLLYKQSLKSETDRREAFRKTQRAIELFMKRYEVKRISKVSQIVYPWPLDGAIRS